MRTAARRGLPCTHTVRRARAEEDGSALLVRPGRAVAVSVCRPEGEAVGEARAAGKRRVRLPRVRLPRDRTAEAGRGRGAAVTDVVAGDPASAHVGRVPRDGEPRAGRE